MAQIQNLNFSISTSQSQAEAHYRGSRHAKKLKSQENKAKAKLSNSAETNGSVCNPAGPAPLVSAVPVPLVSANSSTNQHTGSFLSSNNTDVNYVTADVFFRYCFIFLPLFSLQISYPEPQTLRLLSNLSSSPLPPLSLPPPPLLVEQAVSLLHPAPHRDSQLQASLPLRHPLLPKCLLLPLPLLSPPCLALLPFHLHPPRMLHLQWSQKRRRRKSCCIVLFVKSRSTRSLSWRRIMQVRRVMHL